LLAQIKNPDPLITMIILEMKKVQKSDFIVTVVGLAALVGFALGFFIGAF